jgi:tRNA nucleotidyltransferase (CCA-adding enzyme)
MPNLAALMERALDRALFEFIKDASMQAATLTDAKVQGLYLVGGQVRDLLLERPVLDIDLMIAGDVRAFARAMAARLGGEVHAATVFGTVKLKSPTINADVAMARREYYPSPGALPVVEPGDPREDLSRRDFTVNAMAVDLWPGRFGTLIDLFGGMRDITMKRLRFLHEKSFQDDPTRILRGLRYEARFGFQFEARTAERLAHDAQYLEHVTGARVRAELEKILREPSRAIALANAEERGVLAAVHPALRVPKRITDAMAQSGGTSVLFYVALIGAGLTEEESGAVVARLEPPREWNELLFAGPKLRQLVRLLESPDLKPSEIVDILSPYPMDAVRAQLALAPATLQRDRMSAYVERLSQVQPESNGDDLLAAGVPQGPLVGALLEELRRARLDGALKTKDEELAFAKRRLPILQARSAITPNP